MKISKTFGYLLLIFLLALVLRFIAAFYVDVGTDEMIYSIIPLNIISAGRLGTVFQSPLYFYLADVGYTLSGGLSSLSARLPSIIFGSFAVFVIYLLAAEIFQNKKIGLISSFLFALSGYALQNNTESDMAAFFFVLLSVLFFMRGLKGSHNYFYVSSLFIALAMLIKNIVVVFIPVYVLIMLVYSFKEKTLLISQSDDKIRFNRKFVKVLLLSAGIFILVTSPVLIYNYLIYRYNGFADFYFSPFGIGENIYQGIANKSWELTRLGSSMQGFAVEYFRFDALIFIFGVVGLALAVRKHKYGSFLFMLMVASLLAFVGGITGLASHALWIPLSLSLFAGYALFFLHEKIKIHFQFKHTLPLLLIFAVILNVLYFQGLSGRSKDINSTIPLWKFIHEYVPEDAIVVMDPRIYRGTYTWAMNDRHYIEGTYLPEVLEVIEKSSGIKGKVPLFYIECGPGGYCGWKPEDFERIKDTGDKISDFLVPNMEQVAELKTEHHFVVYKGAISAPTSIYNTIDSTHVFWFYPVGWKGEYDQVIDTYNPQGFDVLLNAAGFLILYLNLCCALLSLPYVMYLAVKEKREELL